MLAPQSRSGGARPPARCQPAAAANDLPVDSGGATAAAEAAEAARLAEDAREREELPAAAAGKHHGVAVRRADPKCWHLCEHHDAPIPLFKVVAAAAAVGSELILCEFNVKTEPTAYGLALWAAGDDPDVPGGRAFAPLRDGNPGGIQRVALATNVKQDADRGLRMFAPLVDADTAAAADDEASVAGVALPRRLQSQGRSVRLGARPLAAHAQPEGASTIEFFESPGATNDTRGCGFTARIPGGGTKAGRSLRGRHPLPRLRVPDGSGGVRELSRGEVLLTMACNLRNVTLGSDAAQTVLYDVAAEDGGVRCSPYVGAPARPEATLYYGGRHGPLANKDAIALFVNSVTNMQVYCTAWHEIKQQWRFRKLKKVSDICTRNDEGRIRFTASDDLADQLLLDDSGAQQGRFELAVRDGRVCMRYEVRFDLEASQPQASLSRAAGVRRVR